MNRKDDTLMTNLIIGISSSYSISCFNDRFSAKQMADAFGDAAGMGFSGFQAEVFHRKTPSDWQQRGAGSVTWPRLVQALSATDDDGDWDLRIICPPKGCREEYKKAHSLIASHIQPATAGSPAP